MSEMNQEFLKKLLSGQYVAKESTNQQASNDTGDKLEKEVSSSAMNQAPEFERLPISLLTDYPDQPLPPYTENELTELVDSIRANGVITPLLVRPYEDGFQIIDGRNRRDAAREAGYEAVPCFIRDLSDDDAAIYLVETIFRQRDMSKVSIMQKAHAYRLWLDAMKRQGRRSDLTSEQIAPKLSSEVIADQQGISKDQVKRLIRLTYLISDLQNKIDENKSSFPLMAAVLVSYLTPENQASVHQFFFADHNYDITIKIAERLREEENAGTTISQELLNTIYAELGESKPSTVKIRRLVLPQKELKFFYKSGYFKEDTTEKEMFATIREWADYYFKNKRA